MLTGITACDNADNTVGESVDAAVDATQSAGSDMAEGAKEMAEGAEEMVDEAKKKVE